MNTSGSCVWVGGGGAGGGRGQGATEGGTWGGGWKWGVFDQLDYKGPKWLQINLGRPKL